MFQYRQTNKSDISYEQNEVQKSINISIDTQKPFNKNLILLHDKIAKQNINKKSTSTM